MPGTTTRPPTAAAAAPRVIGPLAAFAVVAGSMLGVGIFLLPGPVAGAVGSTPAFLAIWGLGGLFALSGAVACGELGAMMPRAGGDYVFQRAAFGPSMAFASGWVLFAAIFGGSIAGMSVAVFQYQVATLLGADLTDSLFTLPLPGGAGLPVSSAQLLAIGLIVVLTGVNDAGTRLSARLQIVLTLAPFAALVLIAGYGLTLAGAAPPGPGPSQVTFAGLLAGFLLVNFAYSGWINVIYVAGEVRDPARNVPRSMITATLGVTGLYLLLCLSFVSALGLWGLVGLGHVDAGTALARAVDSEVLGLGILLVITVAIVTSLNATILSSARVAYAMGQDGAFWRGAARLRPTTGTPRRALWAQAALSSALVLSGTFEDIIKMTSIAMFVTGSLTVLSLFVLRRARPDAPRPYRASLYPWLPGLYVVLALVAIGAMILEALRSAAPGRFHPLVGLGLFWAMFFGHVAWRWATARRGARRSDVRRTSRTGH